MITCLHGLDSLIWREKIIPKDFKNATLINVYKNIEGDNVECGNYTHIL